MQDIVFFVSANETLGLVRDYANMHRADAPVLTIGVAVCLRMRLFADIEVSTPYPIASFSGITNWRWSMDADFDRSTACKLVADEDGISVHTVTDTVSGETRSFTEFVIPISNMNTQELAAWLGNESTRSGLTGELVGYDNNGNAIFVLQVENFTVRNRVAGLCDPTAVDEGIVTRSVAEQMIQTAVFSLAATKQDKLTASNGGMGISVTSTGIISVSNVPQSAVTGLSASLAGKQNALAFGWGLDHDYLDDVLSLARYRTVYSPTGATVTIVPGEAYKINAAASAKMIEAASIPDNTWGLEGHLEIFVAGTGYVQTGENVFLANALKPDAVNNCTVRFHDGYAIISVEDHIAGYIVMVNATSGSGSLNYALGVSTEYISVDASLNGQTLDLAGAVTNGEKHFVGNGYTETIVSGGINCTSKTTLSNLAADGVIVSSGTLTLGDVYIPSGSTVAVSGGGLAVEKVTGNGGVIDLGGTNVEFSSGSTASASGCTFSGGSTTGAGGAFNLTTAATLVLYNVELCGNSAGGYAGAIAGTNNNKINLTSCYIHDNQDATGVLYQAGASALMTISGSTIGAGQRVYVAGGTLNLVGSNLISATVVGAGKCIISSGAIVDLTGNSNATPIAPGGGITFESGGATVLYSSGAVSGSYMMDNVTLPAGAKLTNTNVIDLGQTENSMNLTSGQVGSMSNVTVTGYNSDDAGHITGAVFITGNGEWHLSNCIGTGNKATGGGAFMGLWGLNQDAHAYMTDCVVSGNTFGIYGYASIQLYRAATVELNGCTISEPIGLQHSGTTAPKAVFSGYNKLESPSGKVMGVAGSGTVTVTSGATVDLTGNSNSTPINPGGGVIVDGGCQVITSAGSTVSIAGGTYTQINNDGTTE